MTTNALKMHVQMSFWNLILLIFFEFFDGSSLPSMCYAQCERCSRPLALLSPF